MEPFAPTAASHFGVLSCTVTTRGEELLHADTVVLPDTARKVMAGFVFDGTSTTGAAEAFQADTSLEIAADIFESPVSSS